MSFGVDPKTSVFSQSGSSECVPATASTILLGWGRLLKLLRMLASTGLEVWRSATKGLWAIVHSGTNSRSARGSIVEKPARSTVTSVGASLATGVPIIGDPRSTTLLTESAVIDAAESVTGPPSLCASMSALARPSDCSSFKKMAKLVPLVSIPCVQL